MISYSSNYATYSKFKGYNQVCRPGYIVRIEDFITLTELCRYQPSLDGDRFQEILKMSALEIYYWAITICL